MHVVHALVLAVYYASLTLLVCYGAHRLWLTWLYVKRGEEPCADPGDTPLPRVTVQLPMYNERLVAERLIREGPSRFELCPVPTAPKVSPVRLNSTNIGWSGGMGSPLRSASRPAGRSMLCPT